MDLCRGHGRASPVRRVHRRIASRVRPRAPRVSPRASRGRPPPVRRPPDAGAGAARVWNEAARTAQPADSASARGPTSCTEPLRNRWRTRTGAPCPSGPRTSAGSRPGHDPGHSRAGDPPPAFAEAISTGQPHARRAPSADREPSRSVHVEEDPIPPLSGTGLRPAGTGVRNSSGRSLIVHGAMIKKSLPQYPGHFSATGAEVQFRAFRRTPQGLSADTAQGHGHTAAGRLRGLARHTATGAFSVNSSDPKDRWET